MSSAIHFDPYHKWLGIPPEDQPPTHYRLLGLRPFEADADVIQSAADQRMAHVRTYQAGTHGSLSQKILNELAAARVCLLRPDRKAAYDAELRLTLAPKHVAPPPVLPVASLVPTAVPVAPSSPAGPDFQVNASGRRRGRKRSQPSSLVAWLSIFLVVALPLAIGAIWVLTHPSTVPPHSTEIVQPPAPETKPDKTATPTPAPVKPTVATTNIPSTQSEQASPVAQKPVTPPLVNSPPKSADDRPRVSISVSRNPNDTNSSGKVVQPPATAVPAQTTPPINSTPKSPSQPLANDPTLLALYKRPITGVVGTDGNPLVSVATLDPLESAAVWNMESRFRQFQLGQFRVPKTCIAAVPGQQLYFFGAANGGVVAWDLRQPEQEREYAFARELGIVTALAALADGKTLAIAGQNKVVLVNYEININENRVVQETLVEWTGFTAPITALVISPQAQRLVAGCGGTFQGGRPIASNDTNLHGYDVPTRSTKDYPGHHGSVWDMALSENGSRLATASSDGKVRLWDTNQGRLTNGDARPRRSRFVRGDLTRWRHHCLWR